MDRGRGRTIPRVRGRRIGDAPGSAARRLDLDFDSERDLSQLSPGRMIRFLRRGGHLPGPSTEAMPSVSVPAPQQPPDPTTQRTLASLESVLQRLLAQAPALAPVSMPSTAPLASTTTGTGKPTLKFPDPPLFEGDPMKLDGWVTQTCMYLKAYNVDLHAVRAVDVATMFLRGKAQDWWTGQFRLQEAGAAPVLGTWAEFVKALTDAFRPVELARRHMSVMLNMSQGKQDMRTYIATFNAARAKVPDAFPEELLCHLFLQGCRPDLQKNIALQYPKTLAEYFTHAISLSDLPNSNPLGSKSGKAEPKTDKPSSKPTCTHCHKVGHTTERCFLLHPELRKKKPSSSKT